MTSLVLVALIGCDKEPEPPPTSGLMLRSGTRVTLESPADVPDDALVEYHVSRRNGHSVTSTYTIRLKATDLSTFLGEPAVPGAALRQQVTKAELLPVLQAAGRADVLRMMPPDSSNDVGCGDTGSHDVTRSLKIRVASEEINHDFGPCSITPQDRELLAPVVQAIQALGASKGWFEARGPTPATTF